jgi:two-component system CheB/CheR fusion protein
VVDQPLAPSYLVGIGASAGGLEAFLEFFRALPVRTGMSFVVIQHLEPNYESHLVEILSRSTEIPVIKAEEGMTVEADHIYVIPPNTVMVIRDGSLHLAPRIESSRPHYPVDLFFESLALERGITAVGVVLSGAGSDGAQGIRAIKTRCGITFAQDERTARYGGMPHSAIATGAVDFILPPKTIAEELARSRSHPFLTAPAEDLEHKVAEAEENDELQKILERLKGATRVDFTSYKLSTIRRRLGRRLVVNHLSTLGAYLEYLDRYPSEIQDLYRDLLISVTSFFREPEMFEALAKIIPEYLDKRSSTDPFRVWIPGCATGEEAYSLAMVAFEILQNSARDRSIQVFGTDISDTAIDRARTGVYPEKSVAGISPERLQRFFTRTDTGYRIKQQIRETCVFARHDLTNDPPFSQMDLVSCRNVFIYLNSALQHRILPALHYSLKPGGLLILGSAETVGTRTDLFDVVDSDNKIYVQKQAPAGFIADLRPPVPSDHTAPAPGSPSRPALAIPTLMEIETRAARMMRDLYAPAGVIIDEDMQVLHFHGQTGFYLEHVPGEASLNLLRLVRESLVYPLRNALEAAVLRKQPVHEPGIVVHHGDESRRIKLSVLPLSTDADYCLVLFEEEVQTDGITQPVHDRAPDRATDRAEDPGAAELQLDRVQRDLSQTRDYLRSVIEQHEATTEELRAANEEARSTNEELQSTNEELRTAKEQLQSSNEELSTLNDELKHRNIELNLVSNDLSNILNAATIPIIMVGTDLRLRRFTPAAERIFHMAPGDIGRPVTDIHYPFSLPHLKNMLVETLNNLTVQHRRIQNGDGCWFDLYVRPYRTIDDRIEGAVITFIDIDEATRALEAAENARAFAEGIVETVQHPMLVLDNELRVRRATGAFYRTFEARLEDTVGRTLETLGGGQWRVPELRALLEKALVDDLPFRDLEITREFPNIGTRTMRLHARRIPSTDANYQALVAIEDVTDRQEAAEIQYRRLFESAKDAIIVADAQTGIVLDVNPYFVELSRYPKADLLQKPFREIGPFIGVAQVRDLIPDTRERDAIRYESVLLTARDRREIIVDIVANCYRVKDRGFIQVNIRDVTEKKRGEEELRRSNLDLQQFAFAASHDLQEPLRTITSFLELFQRQHEGKLGPEADQHIRFIVGAASHMRQLVLDLMGFAQVARSEMNRQEIGMEAILSTVLLNLQLAIESSHAQITFDALPAVYADETQMHRLLQNLISNSIKYRSKETPRIHLSARDAGSEWVFSVQDNGIGLNMKYADHIFTVFKRLHGREFPGTGIGLAVCKRIVERHGGRIWVESQPGAGATFFFSLTKRERQD